MDDDSATLLGDSFANSITTLFWYAPHIGRSISDYNFTHTAVVNALWQVPGPRAGLAHAALGGWEVGGIFKANSGVPTTPLITGDVIGAMNNGSDTFGIPDKVPGCNATNSNFKSNPGGVPLGYINTSCFHVPMASEVPAAFRSQCVAFTAVPGSCSNLLGNAGRNSIVGPSLYNVDLSLIKNFAVKKISESFNVQFRAEFFNVLNHANFAPPLPFFGNSASQLFNTNGTSLNSGGIDTTVTDPRDIQFALKVMW